MVLLANPPPVPFAGKMVIALIALALVGIVACQMRGGWACWQLIVAAVIATVASVAAMEPLHGGRGNGLHDVGLVAAILGGLFGAVLLRPISSQKAHTQWFFQSALAIIVGPLTGLAVGVTHHFFAPDEAEGLAPFLVIGTLAGSICAGFIAVTVFFGGTSKGDGHRDREGKGVRKR